MKRQFGDRRVHPRFDIVGELWGSLEAVVPCPVENLGPGGVFFYSHVALPTDSVHEMTVTGGHQEYTVKVQVRHVRATTDEHGEPAFAIGVEFLGAPPGLLTEMQAWTDEAERSDQ